MKQTNLLWQIKLLAAKADSSNTGLWFPLWMHAKDTAETMHLLVQHWLPASVRDRFGLSEEQLVGVARFIGAAHDIGKATALFQSTIMQMMPEARDRLAQFVGLPKKFLYSKKTPHARASEAILLELGCPPGLASVAGAHHGKPQENEFGNEVRDQIDIYFNNYWAEKDEAHWRHLWENLFQMALALGGFESAKELPAFSISQELLLTGLLIMADWIASNTAYFPLIETDKLGDEALYPKRVDLAWGHLSLTAPWAAEYCSMDETAFRERFGFAPNEMQRMALKVASELEAPGLFILEAQMGGGKTEAALATAEILAAKFGLGGLYFGLPTQATANGIFDRLGAWAKTQSENTVHSIRLAHGMAELNEAYRALFVGTAVTDENDFDGGVYVHDWFQGNKQALLADFVIGTVDQLLLAALKQKHIMLRHLGLAGKVVIVDECHAYDTYMNRYLDRVLAWLGNYCVPVILLSATLPAKRRTELIDAYQGVKSNQIYQKDNCFYPRLTWTNGQKVEQMHIDMHSLEQTVHIRTATEAELPALLRDAMQDGGCAGVIVNTVKKAQILATRLRDELGFKVLLFHAQFIQPDRIKKEKELLFRLGKTSNPKVRDRLIVIGTQVLEQSLDLDFDFLITELCPMDLLLQRIGRLHRHAGRFGRPQRLQPPCCVVLDTQEEDFDAGSKAIYGEWLLWRTRRLLPKTIVLPKDIPVLVQKVYHWESEDCLPADHQSEQFKVDYCIKQKIKAQKANQFAIPPPVDCSGQSNWEAILDDWMSNLAVDSDQAARAAVRDGDPSLDVLVMMRREDSSVHFLPWQEEGQAVATDRPPTQQESQKIARQKLRLPGFFSRNWKIDSVIDELEEQNCRFLSQWQYAPMLKGELILLLDASMKANLAQTVIAYDQKMGLTYWEEEANGGERI